MNSKNPSSLVRRVERLWAERIKSPRQIHRQMVAAIERALQRVLNNEGALVPIPVRTVADRRRLDRPRSRD
jgi:hypothetical protein